MKMNLPTIKINVCEYCPERGIEKRRLDEEDSTMNLEGFHKQNDFNEKTTTRKPDFQEAEEERAQTSSYPENSKQRRTSPERVQNTTRTAKIGEKPSMADSPKRQAHGQRIMKTAEESTVSNSKGPVRKAALPKVAWNKNRTRDDKKESLPKLKPRNAENNGDIAALVSPVLLRKYTHNRIPVDISPLKGSKKMETGAYPDALFRNSARSRARLSLDIPKIKVRSLSQERGRSHSMGNIHNAEEEKHFQAAKIGSEPSKHWRKAREYTVAKESRLPEIVKLCSQLGRMQLKMSTGDKLEEVTVEGDKAESKGYTWEQENDTENKLNKKTAKLITKSKSEGILSSLNETDETQCLRDKRTIVSLKERLEAIEKQYGIVHHGHLECKNL